jgi:hypothetical protein
MGEVCPLFSQGMDSRLDLSLTLVYGYRSMKLSADELQISKCSVVDDDEVMAMLVGKLAENAEQRRAELVKGLVRALKGRKVTPQEASQHYNERSEDGTVIWVCWDDRAIAVRTAPIAKIVLGKGGREELHYMWHWKPLLGHN